MNKPFMLANAQQQVGQALGISPWVLLTRFRSMYLPKSRAGAHQAIATPEHAKTTPYGGTLLHGFHAIALLSHFYKAHNCGRRMAAIP